MQRESEEYLQLMMQNLLALNRSNHDLPVAVVEVMSSLQRRERYSLPSRSLACWFWADIQATTDSEMLKWQEHKGNLALFLQEFGFALLLAWQLMQMQLHPSRT